MGLIITIFSDKRDFTSRNANNIVYMLHIIRNVFYGIYFVNSKHQKIFIFGKIQKDPI